MIDYVDRFACLYDKLSAYEDATNSLHYTTRFLDGLKPGVCVVVALQKPKDLDVAYDIVLLHEELGDGFTPLNTPTSSKSGASPLLLPPKVHTVVEKRFSEVAKPV